MVSQLRKKDVNLYLGLSHEIPIGLKTAGISSCVVFHDLIFERHPEWFPFLDRQLYRIKYRYAARAAQRIISVSKSTARDLEEMWGIDASRINIVYQACADHFYAVSSSSNDRTYFLLVGALTERKGILDLVEAYHSLEYSYRLPVKIIGSGKHHEKEIRRKISSYDLNESFQFLGSVDNDQLVEYYLGARALIYPSRYEGFGIPVIEASLCKTPVICADVSSLPEAGGPGAIYFVAGNPESLAERIRFCIDKYEEVAKEAENSYIYVVNKFDPFKTACSLMNILESLYKEC